MTDHELKFLIALNFLPQIGSRTARKLIAYVGSAEAVFSEKKKNLLKIPGIGQVIAENAMRKDVLEKAEKEIHFIRKNRIGTKSIFDTDYPERLKQCIDAPLILFFRGIDLFNSAKILSVVGTRNASEYGIEICHHILRELSESDNEILIVSGLAYGIDYQAHNAALKSGLSSRRRPI